jgi:tetratricopeptide (TPR) repeat protein
MAIDTYAPCPGGTGKKIKFCCSDLVGDIEQLDRLLEGEQVSAALDLVKRLSEKHPGRACLMASRVKLELATKHYAEAEAASKAFLGAFPDNPLALALSAMTDALAGRVQEAAALFDKARDVAAGASRQEGMQDVSPELARIAATLVQAAAQSGHSGFAQSIVEWITDRGLSNDDEQRMLAAIVGSVGVPPSLRTRMPLEEATGDESWRPDFDVALAHAKAWRLTKALTGFRSLRGVAGSSGSLHTNIAILCEMLAKPMEAGEAWLAFAKLPGAPVDDAIEATGRAIALETEANPERSPLIRFANRIAPLAVPPGEEGITALELLEDKLRHEPRCESAAFDRSAWVSRNAAPPRSAWRVYDAGGNGSPRLLASLLIFGRQTDREPEAMLQGLAPDVESAMPVVSAVLGCSFSPATDLASMPGVTPTNWLLGSQFKVAMPAAAPAAPAAGEPALFDTMLATQRKLVDDRLVAMWPETPLPELLGKTPRQAVADAEGRRRVEAIVTEGEATSRRRDIATAWATLRRALGLPEPRRIESQSPLGEVPPMRWHRLDFGAVPIDQLRGVLVTALDAGFVAAADRAAEELVKRPDATPEDRWEALGGLLEGAETSVRRLELIAKLREIARELKANDGSLDVAELRVRMQRGDEADVIRIMDHVRRDHANDRQVIQGVTEVLMEAGVDLQALAARGGMGAPGAAAAPAASASAAGKLWTPGGEQPSAGGEKKTIWTPGS